MYSSRCLNGRLYVHGQHSRRNKNKAALKASTSRSRPDTLGVKGELSRTLPCAATSQLAGAACRNGRAVSVCLQARLSGEQVAAVEVEWCCKVLSGSRLFIRSYSVAGGVAMLHGEGSWKIGA